MKICEDTAVNSTVYCCPLGKLLHHQDTLCPVRPWPSVCLQKVLSKISLPMPYPLDLAPLDYVLFDKMKNVLHVARLVCYIHQEVTRKIAKVLTSQGSMCSVLKCD
jgi:hypothetical protein